MLEIVWITVCPECRVGWGPEDDPACTTEGHGRVPYETHRHRTPVVLPDGTTVVAVSFHGADPYGRPEDEVPAFGLYLDERWQPPWTHGHVDWPDFGVPADVGALRAALTDVLERARAGERVELGCLGAHGRTGTALACLAVLTGVPAPDAVAWVRETYCDQAVETPGQAELVAAFGADA